MECTERGNKEGQIMGNRITVDFGKNVLTTEEIITLNFCYRPLGKHSLARGNRRAKRREIRGIMGKAREEKQHGS